MSSKAVSVWVVLVPVVSDLGFGVPGAGVRLQSLWRWQGTLPGGAEMAHGLSCSSVFSRSSGCAAVVDSGTYLVVVVVRRQATRLRVPPLLKTCFSSQASLGFFSSSSLGPLNM